MKILVIGDLHICKQSSIIKKFGTNFSARLEHCISSLEWVEKIGKEYNCEAEIFLGDVFDAPTIDDETITAVKTIKWNNIPKIAIVGNHESSTSSLNYTSLNCLADNFKIISKPAVYKADTLEICYLPYIIESDRKTIKEYFGEKSGTRIVISHNDLAGVSYGPIISKTGFTITDIEANADLFLNGHLHNGEAVTNKIINVGNLIGDSFGEDASRYQHRIMILDTDTLEYTFVENPHAFNFYKLDIETSSDFLKLDVLKNNAVLSIKCKDKLVEELKQLLPKYKNIFESRIIITHDIVSLENTESITDLISCDHIAKFIDCVKAHYTIDKILEEELNEVCK